MISQRVKRISPSATLAISSKAKEMRRQGIDVIDFGVGEPDFDTPDHIKDGGIKAIEEGFTKYTPAAGIPELREAICRKLKVDNGLQYTPDQILVSVGAKHSLYNAVQTLCEDGDEVIIPAPYWVTYPEQVKLAGGVPVIVETDPEEGFRLDPDRLAKAVTPRTRLLILNSPQNPSGAVYPAEDLKAIAEIVVENGLYVLSDEVYEKLVYDGEKHTSIAALGEEIKRRTVVINGVSKTYAMTGWRIGYAAAEVEIIKAMAKLQEHLTGNPASIAQKAAVEALEGSQKPVAEMITQFAQRRDYMVERLSSLAGFVCPCPKGAFYAFPNISQWHGKTIQGRRIGDGTDLAAVILEEAHVAVVPGTGFGFPDCIRFSYATSMENIKEGLDRIERLLSGASW